MTLVFAMNVSRGSASEQRYIDRVLKVRSQYKTRNNGLKLNKIKPKKDRPIGERWFGERVVAAWYRLPDSKINDNSADSFRSMLDRHMTKEGWTQFIKQLSAGS